MRNIIKFIRRKNLKKNKPLSIIYDICVVRKSSHKRRVLEKLGTYSISGKSLTLNIFRLCFWISRNISFSGNVTLLFFKTKIFNYYYNNNKFFKKIN